MIHFMHAAVTVIFRVCKLVSLLQLFVVTICKWSINPVLNPNPVCSNTLQMVSEKEFVDQIIALKFSLYSYVATVRKWYKYFHACWPKEMVFE
jgi:hypothetical protein